MIMGVKKAYRILELKDAFDALADIAFRLEMISLVPVIILATLWEYFPVAVLVSVLTVCAFGAVYGILRIATIVCEALLEWSGFSEVQLESWVS